MSKVKLRLSGGLAFAANLVGYLTGFIFTVLITRRLSAEEFGVWALISSLIVYSLIPYNLVGSWIARDAVRGKKVLETALALCLLLSPISILIYILSGIGSASAINYDPTTILLGLIVLIPYIFLNITSAIQRGYMPQTIGMSRIFFEISKILLAILFIILLELRLLGALLSISLAYSLQAGFLLYNLRTLRQKKVDNMWMMKWLKGAPVSAVNVLNDALLATNIVLMSIIWGSSIIAGYWQAAISASALVTCSKLLTTGLSARLLSGGGQKDVDKSFSFSMMLTIPLLLGFFVLSKDLLWILRPIYSSAWIAACILATAGTLRSIGDIGATILTATDKFDRSDVIVMKDYLRSKVFLVNGLRTTLTGLNVASVAIYLLLSRNVSLNMIHVINSIATISFIYSIVSLLVNLRLMKKMTKIRLNLQTLRPYVVASTIMAIIVYFLRSLIGDLPEKALEASSLILLLIVAGGLIYCTILYFISQEFKRLLKEAKSYFITSV